MPGKLLTTALILLCIAALSSCGNSKQAANQANTVSTQSSTPAPPPKSAFEQDLDYVRKGQYTYVWVFARKDGKELDKDDGAFLRKNAPQVVDWVATDQGKKVIAGTNFDLAQGNLELLKERFAVEDYSGK